MPIHVIGEGAKQLPDGPIEPPRHVVDAIQALWNHIDGCRCGSPGAEIPYGPLLVGPDGVRYWALVCSACRTTTIHAEHKSQNKTFVDAT